MNGNINLNISFSSIQKAVIAFLHRFHVVIFVVVVLGGLAVIVLMLNNIIIRSGEAGGYTAPGTESSFDQATIKKVESFSSRSDSDANPPAGSHTNPFIE